MQRHNTVVLGASGLVAQRMQQRLSHHPWFELVAVVGSKRTAGDALDSVAWNLEETRPELPSIQILDAAHKDLVQTLRALDVTVAFSCIPADVADPLELELSSAGIAVFSNSSAFRRCDGVPLVIPDVNPAHMSHFGSQKRMLACATNCTLIPLAVPVAALSEAFGIANVRMNSEQALSGAGYELLLSHEARRGNHSNLIPGEAEKTSAELLHVLGNPRSGLREADDSGDVHQKHPTFDLADRHVLSAAFGVEVQCKRVTRLDGHQIFATVSLHRQASIEAVIDCFENHRFNEALQASPSAPATSIQIVDVINPEQHLWADGNGFPIKPDPSLSLKAGMAVVVGSIRMVDSTTVEFSALSHNTIRGAAGGTMLLAEQAYIEQRLPKQQ